MEMITAKETEVLRRLAAQVAELAARPEQAEKAKLWTLHNDLKTSQPLIFCDPEGGWDEIITNDSLQCEGNMARYWEKTLRQRIFFRNGHEGRYRHR